MTIEIPTTLGRRIADCRDRLGLKQKELAEKAGLSVTFLSEVENDRRVPGTKALLGLANALGSSLDYLVKGIVEAPPSKRSLVIPHELSELADEGQLPLAHAGDLVRFRDMVFARRSLGGAADEAGRTLSRDDWSKLYEAYLSLLGKDRDDSHR